MVKRNILVEAEQPVNRYLETGAPMGEYDAVQAFLAEYRTAAETIPR